MGTVIRFPRVRGRHETPARAGASADIIILPVVRIERMLEPPPGVKVGDDSGHIRGQVPAMRQMFNGLTIGLGLAVVVVILMLTAYFQSLRLALVSVATTPAVLAGVAFALYITNTTLNIQSFMGAIMAIGVAVANAILLVTFAENARQTGIGALDGARACP